MSQNDPKTTSLMTSVKKIRNPQPKRGARALVRQPKTAVFYAEIEVQIYRTPALKVLRG